MKPLITLSENTAGRDFVVSDIHGHFARLEAQLAAQAFDPEKDRVIAVGDLLDRGPDSERALEFLRKPWFFSVRGNHEQAMIDWLDLLLAGEPVETVRKTASRHAAIGGAWSLPILQSGLSGTLAGAQHWRNALASLPWAISFRRASRRIGVVHATVPEGDWSVFNEPGPRVLQETLWSRRPLGDVPHGCVQGIDLVFVGHNLIEEPEQIGNLWMIETGIWQDGPLTLVDVDNWPVSTARGPLWRRWFRSS